MKRIFAIVGAFVAGVAILIVCTNMLGTGFKNPEPVRLPSDSPSAGATLGKATGRAATSIAPRASVRPETIREGTWVVGQDVKAGQYKTSGALDGLCYWHTARDTSDDTIVDQGVVNAPKQQGYVTLKNGQYFKTSGCAEWYLVK